MDLRATHRQRLTVSIDDLRMSHIENCQSLHNLAYLEQLLERYRHAPQLVPKPWRDYFSAANESKIDGLPRRGPSFRPRSLFDPVRPPIDGESRTNARPGALESSLHERLEQLVRNYRERGHQMAMLDPLWQAAVRLVSFSFRTSWLHGGRA